eukprot:scaffold116332_cov35-Tisochrysis_lutea.AAC.2
MSRLGLSRRFTYGPYTIFNILIHPRMHLSSMAAVQTKTNKSFRGIKMAHLECSFISPPEPDKGKPVRPMVARLVGPHALMALNRSRRPLRVGRDGRKEVGLFVKGSSHFFGHLAICRIGNDRLDRKGSQSFRDRHRAHGRRAAPRKGNAGNKRGGSWSTLLGCRAQVGDCRDAVCGEGGGAHVSGERPHCALMLMRPTIVERASTSGAALSALEVKMAACWPFQESLAALTTSESRRNLRRHEVAEGSLRHRPY